MRMDDVCTLLSGKRIAVNDERELQEALARLLGDGWERERVLGKGMRADFIEAGGRGVLIETKTFCGRSAVLRQIARYAECDDVLGIVVVTVKPLSAMPDRMGGKPVRTVQLWRGGL